MPQKLLGNGTEHWWWLIIQSKPYILFLCRVKILWDKGIWDVFDLEEDQGGPWDFTHWCFYGITSRSVTYKLGTILYKFSAPSGAEYCHVIDRKEISTLVFKCLRSGRRIHLHNVWGVQCFYAWIFPGKMKCKRLVSWRHLVADEAFIFLTYKNILKS